MLKNPDEIRKTYEDKLPILRLAENKLRSILEATVATIEDKTLVRAEIRSVRIKEVSSLLRKAQSSGWDTGQLLSRCQDLVGGRVICNNVADIYRFAELLKERLHNPWGRGHFELQDCVLVPNEGGYRALHVNFRLDLEESPFHSELVPCEVQIRSRLQDAWAELSHEDIYKQPDLPDDLRARAKDLAEVLAAADKIAGCIRSRVTRETAPPKHRPDLSQVSEDGLTYSFREVFGRSPPDYAIRLALNLCHRLQITTLEGLPELLARPEFRDKIAETYRSIIGVKPQNEDLLLAALHATVGGDTKAIKWIKKEARRERRKLEQFVMREALGSLPDTVEEFVERLEDPRGESDIELWAEVFGATNDCSICGTTVIQPFSFAEAAVQHYETSEVDDADVHERIEAALRASSAETGGWGDGSLCACHNEQTAKDE